MKGQHQMTNHLTRGNYQVANTDIRASNTNSNPIPPELIGKPLFVFWKLVPTDDGKVKKLPVGPDGNVLRGWSNNRSLRMTGREALATGNSKIGIILDQEIEPGLVCIDLDNVRDPATGKVDDEIPRQIVQAFCNFGAYIETSQSGTGYHIFTRLTHSAIPLHNSQNSYCAYFCGLKVELKVNQSFVALTGRDVDGHINADCTPVFDWLIPQLTDKNGQPKIWNERANTVVLPAPGVKVPRGATIEQIRALYPLEPGDHVIIEKMKRDKRWPGAVAALNADYDTLTKLFPPNAKNKQWDYSDADIQLFGSAAWHTVKDEDAMLRIMIHSPFFRPSKLDRYQRRDIPTAISGCNRPSMVEMFSGPGSLTPTMIAAGARPASEGTQTQWGLAPPAGRIIKTVVANDGNVDVTHALSDITCVEDMFKRLVFIAHDGAIGDLKTKGVWTRQTVAIMLKYVSFEDENGKRQSGFKTWESSAFRKRITVDRQTWDPGAKDICSPVQASHDGEQAFNTWSGLPAFTPRPDAPQALLDHVAYLIPDERDCKLFMQWCAHIVQRPEELPTFGFLMITPTEGIGRNMLMSVLDGVLGPYSVRVGLEKLLNGNFNSELSRRFLVYVDEVHEPGAKKYKVANDLKELVTSTKRQINIKNVPEFFERNCARWVLLSNHYDAVPLAERDRRFHVIENPTQTRSPAEYRRLSQLLRSRVFLDQVRTYLQELDITDFDPFTIPKANDAKRRVIESTRSELDDLVLQFLEEYTGEFFLNRQLVEFIRSRWQGDKFPNAKQIGHSADRYGTTYVKQVKIDQKKEKVRAIIQRISPDVVLQLDGKAIAASVSKHRWGGAPVNVSLLLSPPNYN